MKVALGVEYEGINYCGFQKQPQAITIQGELEKALSKIADEQVSLVCAGRTDAGVNATGQVIHIEVSKPRKETAFVLGTNTFLPQGIAITWAKFVSDDFHARFSARARRYRYILFNTKGRPAVLAKGLSIYHGSYDVKKMHDCAQILIGEHDFASFRSSEDQSLTSMRCVFFIDVSQIGPYIIFDIAANAFLNHMVRNIVGSLLLVGQGVKDDKWFADIFAAKDRNVAGPTAHPNGLYLVDVTYPQEFMLPRRDFLGPLWLK